MTTDPAPLFDLTFPWPPSALSPNQRQHWAQLAKAKKSYREQCWALAKHQGAHQIIAERLDIGLEFVPPSRRKFDLDNLLARMKAGLDGLADVLGVDDSRWSIRIERSDCPVPPGFVLVTVTPLEIH